MIVANVRIDGVRAVPSERMPITAGMIGAQVRIAYTDPVWDGLRKTVVFHGCVTKDVVSDGDVITIPPEVIARPDVRLHIGVYGIDGGGSAAIPTLWADLGWVLASASPSGDTATDPSLPVWAQILDTAQKAEAIAQSVREDANSGAFHGRDGDTGPQGPQGEAGPQGDNTAALEAAQAATAAAAAANDAAAAAKSAADTVLPDVAQLKNEMAKRNVFVTPEMFGAVGDGITDDTSAILAAINAADKVVFGNKTYLVNRVQFDKSVELVGGTDTIIRTQTRKHAFYCAAEKPKAKLALAADYVYTDDAGSCGASRITLSDASSVEIGDVLKIYAENQLYNPNRAYYCKGACVLVTDVDRENNRVSIGFVIPFDILADGTVVDVYRGNTVQVRNLNFRSELDDEGAGSSFGLYIKGGVNTLVENCTFDGFTHNLYLDCCVNSLIRACRMAHAKRDNTFAWDGYGVCIGSCSNTLVEHVSCRCGQHALTTGGTIPVFNTHIRDCEMFAECRGHAIGCHENNYDITIENSVIAGAAVIGNVSVRDTRFVQNSDLSAGILIVGNEGQLTDIISFDHVTFDSDMRIAISAYTDRSVRAYSNDVGRVVFNNCYGGRLWIADLSGDTNITGSVIKSITVNNWLECHGFKLEYGTVEILKVDGLRFHLELANGYITSPTAMEIGTACNVLKMINAEYVVNSYDELALKSPGIPSDEVVATDIEITAGDNTRLISLTAYGKTDEEIVSDTIVFESDNLIPGLEDFSMEIRGFNLNGPNNSNNFPKYKIPHDWKAKQFSLAATIDTTNADVTSINSVAAFLLNDKNKTIYSTYLSGKYEQTVYRSTVSFVIPDDAYYMVISARLSATGDRVAKAYDFKFYVNNEFNVRGIQRFVSIPVAAGGTFADESGQQHLCNYLDFRSNIQIRQVEYLYNERFTEDMLTDMSDYFSDGIVGGFIPREIVEKGDGIGRKLDNYASKLPILNTSTPPQNEESIWIHDGGIGFAFSIEKVGERTMAALTAYVKRLPHFLLCELYAPQSYTVSQTQTTQYSGIRLYGGKTRVYSKNGGYFKLGYYRDTKDYIDEQISAATSGRYELIQDVTLAEEQATLMIENLDLKKLVIFSYVKFVEGTGTYGLNLNKDTVKNLAFGDNCNSKDFTRGFLSLDCSEGLLLSQSSANIGSNYSYGISKQPFRSAYEPVLLDSITSIQISSLNSYKFAPESRFIIYGVKS